MAKAQSRLVYDRAAGNCEYCQLPQSGSALPHEVDHIRSQKHHGTSTPENLALACFHCNSYNGPNIAGYDPETGNITPLFNPRTDSWAEHFSWNGALLIGKTPIGRSTIQVLSINRTDRIELRRRLMESGVFSAPSFG